MPRRLLRAITPRSVRQACAALVDPLDRWASRRHNRRFVEALLASGCPIRLEVGAGPKKGTAGWTTADLSRGADLTMNLLGPFPFPDESVDTIYSSHVLEHFYTHELELVLKECLRVLKPSGVISVCVPDAAIYVGGYLYPTEFDARVYCAYEPGFAFYSPIDYLNYIAYMGGHHRHLFDLENLMALLTGTGFRDVRKRDFDPDLDLADRDYQSVYAEARK